MKLHFGAGCKSFHLAMLCAWLCLAALPAHVALAQAPSERAQAAAGTAAGPLVCDQPEYDFGERDNSTEVQHTFQLRNAGDSPLTINRVLTTCGCTAASLKQKTLQPGESVPLEVEVSLRGRKGVFQKHVYVLYGDDAQKRTKLTIEGTARERIRVSPETVPLSHSAGDQPTEATVTIQVLEAPAKFNVTSTGTDSKYLEMSLESSEDGMKHTLHVRTKPPLPLGPHPAMIRIFTDNEHYPRLDIPVALNVVDKIQLMPEEVVVHKRGTGDEKPVVRLLNVLPGSAREFAITGVETPIDTIIAEVIPRPGSRYLIKLENVPVDKSLEGTEIVLLTDIPGKERVAVPIRVREYPVPQAPAVMSSPGRE
jgi:hypothetical protein